jgi:hypothetical protein
MNADLCRKLTLVFSSPGFLKSLREDEDSQGQRRAIEEVCIDAQTESALPDGMRSFFEFCVKSIDVADDLDIQPPYTAEQIEEVIEQMMETENDDM